MISVEIIIDEYGNTHYIDNRIFDRVVEHKIQSIKLLAKEEILRRYPEFKQINSGMGILSTEEQSEIQFGIQDIIQYSNNLENQIRSVVWDGTEENRKTACDAVQNLEWNYIHPVSFPKKYTAYQFLLRFTAQERALFRQAALTDPFVADFQQLAQAAQEIITNDPITIAGMNYLVSVGLLTEQRKNEILS